MSKPAVRQDNLRANVRRPAAAYLACVFAALLFITAGAAAADPDGLPEPGQPMIGELAPDFSLVDVNGQKVSSADLRGSYVVIHFAASW